MNLIEQYDALIKSTDWLAERDQPVALTLTETLEPASGADSIIFPPTFARDKKAPHPYAISDLRPSESLSPEAAQQQKVVANVCDLSTLGDQSNRMEPAFAQKSLASLVPQIAIKSASITVNLLEIGHRIADGAVRYSQFGETAATAVNSLSQHGDASALAKIAPTSLIFGFWDSRASQHKFGRIVASIIRASNVAPIKRSAQFNPAIDPNAEGLEQLVADSFDKEPEKHPLAKLGLRSVPAVDTHGGVRVFGAITRQTEINLVALRQLASVQDGKILPDETLILRRYLLGLALVAARVQSAYHLRQGCLLVQKEGTPPVARIVHPDGKRTDFNWDLKAAFAYAEATAKKFGVGESKDYNFESERVTAALKPAETPTPEKKTPKAKKG